MTRKQSESILTAYTRLLFNHQCLIPSLVLECLEYHRDITTQTCLDKLKTQNTPLLFVTTCQSVTQPNGSAAYIRMSTSTLQNYTLRQGFRTIVHLHGVLVLMHSLHFYLYVLLQSSRLLYWFVMRFTLFSIVVYCIISTVAWLHLK